MRDACWNPLVSVQLLKLYPGGLASSQAEKAVLSRQGIQPDIAIVDNIQMPGY